jgi:pyruvate,water dikinase
VDNLYWLDQSLGENFPYRDQAFYLSQLHHHDYPVVNGFVLPGDVLWQYLEVLGESEVLLADLHDSDLHLDVHQPRQLRDVAQRLRRRILQGSPPAFWLESLTEQLQKISTPLVSLQPFLQHERLPSPAEILETVVCSAQSEAVMAGLKQVWGQLFRAHHLFCWRQTGLKLSQVNLAVLVQPLEEAIASGTVVAQPEQLSIESTWGFPLAIERGEVFPDRYTIHPQTGIILKQQLGLKNRGYRLNLPSQESSPLECLTSYILSPNQQQSYSLTKENLALLSQICKQVQKMIMPHFSLTWHISPSESSPLPHLTITNFTPQVSQGRVMNSLAPLKGVGVARGEARGVAQVMIAGGAGQLRGGHDYGGVAETGRIADLPLNQISTQPLGLSGKILVAEIVLPEWLPFLRSAAGIITEQGGLTSHGAIIARELGIPAVVGVAAATQLIQTGEDLTIDGDQGIVYRQSDQGWERLPQKLVTPAKNFLPLEIPAVRKDALGNPITGTKLMVNLSQPQRVLTAAQLPIDGVGLLRSELILSEILHNHNLDSFQEINRLGFIAQQTNQLPLVAQQVIKNLADQITEFTAAFAPRPVFYRSADWRSAEFPTLYAQEPPEANPVLGRRGTLRYTLDPQLFDWELAALREVQQRGYGNISLLLPFVRTVEEFKFCQQRVQDVGLSAQPQFQLWIMAEVPSAVFLLEDYVKAGVQGISIGSNDLTQLILGIDRDQGGADLLNAGHPAMVAVMQQLVTTARKLNIPCSICGQAPVNYPELVEQLVLWGITSISVDVPALEQVQRSIHQAEQKLLLNLARDLNL